MLIAKRKGTGVSLGGLIAPGEHLEGRQKGITFIDSLFSL